MSTLVNPHGGNSHRKKIIIRLLKAYINIKNQSTRYKFNSNHWQLYRAKTQFQHVDHEGHSNSIYIYSKIQLAAQLILIDKNKYLALVSHSTFNSTEQSAI